MLGLVGNSKNVFTHDLIHFIFQNQSQEDACKLPEDCVSFLSGFFLCTSLSSPMSKKRFFKKQAYRMTSLLFSG